MAVEEVRVLFGSSLVANQTWLDASACSLRVRLALALLSNV